MTESNESNERRYERALRSISRRVSSLEETQLTWNELNVEFDRIYDEIDQFKVEMNQRFDSQDAKIDIILRHIIGSQNSITNN